MLDTKLIKGIFYVVVLLSSSTLTVRGGNILFVTDEPTNPSGGDITTKRFFEKLGHTVTYIDDDENEAAAQAAASKADLVYISESVSSDKINTEIKEVPTPMIVAEPYCFDEMGMSTIESQNQSCDSLNITIINPHHPLAAGYSGEVAVLAENDGSQLIPGPSTADGEAVVIAKGSGYKQKDADVYFVYDKGAVLATPSEDGSQQVAADIRIGIFTASPKIFTLMSPHGFELLKAAVNYAMSPRTQIKVATVNIIKNEVEEEGLNTKEDIPVFITLIGTDPDGDPLNYKVVTGPFHGRLVGKVPKIIYTPEPNFFGSDSFTFNVNDGTIDSTPTTVLINVTGVNDPPIAKDDRIAIQEDTPASITLIGSDPDGDMLSYGVVRGPSYGTLSGRGPNLTYMPKANFHGSDSFTFKVNDGKVDSAEATVSIKLIPVNDPPKGSYTGSTIQDNPPVAMDYSVTTQEDNPVAITLLGSGLVEEMLSYSVETVPSHGSLSGTAPKLIYTPNPDFNGTDSFTFKASYETVESNVATVKITVKAKNDPPSANDDNVTTQEDTAALTINVLMNDTDVDGDKLTKITAVTQGKNGLVSINEDNTLSYAPKVNFYGSDEFTYTVSDGQGGTDTAMVNVTVEVVDDPPVANDASVTTKEDKPVSIVLTGSDPDGDSLSYSVVTGPFHGKLSGTAPNLRYTPKENFNRSDSFTFKVSDKTASSAAATVSITVTAVNDAPKANDDSVTMQEDDTEVEIDVLANDTDVDSDPLKITNVTQGKNGSVSINNDNTLSYTPNKNFYGVDSFAYTVSDGVERKTDTVKVNVTVRGVNDTPRFTSTIVTTATAGVSYIYDVNATDPDTGDTLTYTLTVKPKGMTIDAVTGLIKWTPTSDQAGNNDVVIKVTDNSSTPVSETQSFTIKVEPASTPETTAPTITEEPSQQGKKILLVDSTGNILKASDDKRREISPGLSTTYNFSDIPIPAGSVIASVVINVEHYEQELFPEGKLQWSAGAGWPSKPVIWASINAPVYKGEANEAKDLWDVTSFADTPEKVNSLQLQIKNNDDIAKKKTLVDYIYTIVEWY